MTTPPEPPEPPDGEPILPSEPSGLPDGEPPEPSGLPDGEPPEPPEPPEWSDDEPPEPPPPSEPPPPPDGEPDTGVVPPLGPTRRVVLPGDPGTDVYDELAGAGPAGAGLVGTGLVGTGGLGGTGLGGIGLEGMPLAGTSLDEAALAGETSGLGGRQPAPGWLRLVVAVLASLLVLALVGLIVDKVRPSVLASLRDQPGKAGSPGSGTAPGSSRGHDGHGSTSSSPSSSSSPSGPGPVISSLRPASASGGSQITIEGSGFLSADNQIVATFNGSPTRTVCPTSQRCVATVPSGPKSGTTAVVRVQTESGRSNAATFTYR